MLEVYDAKIFDSSVVVKNTAGLKTPDRTKLNVAVEVQFIIIASVIIVKNLAVYNAF